MLTKIYFNLSSFEIFNQESWYESLAKQLPHPIITSESNESVKNQSARENKNEEGGARWTPPFPPQKKALENRYRVEMKTYSQTFYDQLEEKKLDR